MGLLDLLTDPATNARIDERFRLAERLAQQMGVNRDYALQALHQFENVTTSEGQTLH